MRFSEQHVLQSPTGAMLNYYVRKAEGRPRGIVHISHGLAEHSARYARFADFLARCGYTTYAHDHRGHGATTAPDAPLGVFAWKDGRTKVLADITAMHDLIRREHPTLPLILFGHSMGAIIALNFLQQHSSHLKGAAIFNANVSGGALGRLAQIVLAWERMRLGSDTPSRMLPRLTFQAWGKAVPNARTPFDWLSRDPIEVDKYIADPFCGWDASVSLWRDLFGFIFSGGKNKNFIQIDRDLPLFLVGGGKDPGTDRGKAVEMLASRMSAMRFSNLISKIYPETRHESLNDINRDEVMADFVEWADSALHSAGPAHNE
ncbi:MULTISPECIES: alpha/beta fold hydrolase [Mesorhizobium]|uniref:Alpha/beta hydrolase n=1 Tax=Mesorhizobium denitrificans TaxID=2294114 RepID=A0A371XG97_9HYPH|nr:MULTISPECIES: alpha/beta hydrolase [Mesorhizobium]RFC68240.1 alpha/beta hydrolase [Mesorhizobium denitrificans]